jgi:hypothetical protein
MSGQNCSDHRLLNAELIVCSLAGVAKLREPARSETHADTSEICLAQNSSIAAMSCSPECLVEVCGESYE